MTHSVKVNNPKTEKPAIDPFANIDQHKTLFPMVHDTIGFVRETDLAFAI